MRNFFELLRRRGLSPDSIAKTLTRLTRSDMLDLVAEVRSALPYTFQSGFTRHSFTANKSLSGGAFPCWDIGCRLNKADELARFSALYADRVLIRDPFTDYDHEFNENVLRGRLAGDFMVLFYLEPLLGAGLIGISSPILPTCDDHGAQERGILKTLDGLAKGLEEAYLKDLRFEYYPKTQYVGVTGPEFIVPHGEQNWGPHVDPPITRRGRVRKATERAIFWNGLVGPAISDIMEQGAYARHLDYSYLTDRELDRELIAALTADEVRPIADAITKGLAHAVPVVESADLKALIRLREEEAEAFRVYRDSVTNVLRTADLSSERRIKEAFADAINPELNRIDLAVRNSKKLLKGHLARELVVGAGLVTVGLFLGTVQPAAGAVLAALGGGKFASEVGKRAYDALVPDPPEPRQSAFYFLWKLRRSTML